jgi:nitrate reductase gamma subunit
MYDFVTGPLAWLAFSVFLVGVIARVVLYIRGLDWKLDRVTYTVNVSYGVKGAIRSILQWIFPFGTHSWRSYPFMTVLVFAFHIGILFTPIFLIAHNLIMWERWGIRLWTLPEPAADFLTLTMMTCAVFLVLRRIALSEVRILTTGYDYLVLTIAVAPFFTGYMAHLQVADYRFWLILHILSGEVMLVAIPFTKLSHFVGFFLSRAQIGMDYGIKRGGMKNKGLAW